MAKRILRVERLTRKEERATLKRIVTLSIVSFVIAVFLFTLGVQFLGKFADFLNGIFQKPEDSIIESSAPLPPRVDDLPTATNSAKLSVIGFSSESASVDIYL